MNATLRHEIIKSVIDKLFIGAIVGIAGLIGAGLLESYKSDVAFQRQVNTTRLEKIGVAWDHAYRVGGAYERLSRVLDEAEEADSALRALDFDRSQLKSSPEAEALLRRSLNNHAAAIGRLLDSAFTIDQEVSSEVDIAQAAIQQDRFWIGDEEYKALSEYFDLIRAYADSIRYPTEISLDQALSHPGYDHVFDLFFETLRESRQQREEINEKGATVEEVRQRLLTGR